MKCASVHFYEGDYCIRPIVEKEERLESYRLRHLVFCETLQWQPAHPRGLEIDKYDKWAASLGVFSGQGNLMGLMRLLPADRPFMLESDFAQLVSPGHRIRKAEDTSEVSRFMIAPFWRCKGLSMLPTYILMKALFQWSSAHRIRYVYAVIEKRFWRTLLILGFPWKTIGAVKAFPPANVESAAVVLDWNEFQFDHCEDRPDFLDWISTARSTPDPLPMQRHGFDWRRRTSRRCFEHETSMSVR